MKKKTWTIIGVGDFIHEILDLIDFDKNEIRYCVLAGNKDEHRKSELAGSTQLVTPDNISEISTTDYYFFGVINLEKKHLLSLMESTLKAAGGKDYLKVFPNIIHPDATVYPSARIGNGNFIGAGSVVGSRVKIGNFNFLNRLSSVGHDTVIGNFNHLAPGATVCGLVEIADNTTIGTNATVIDEIKIAGDVFVGAGAAVVKDIDSAGKYVGVPAKMLVKGSK